MAPKRYLVWNTVNDAVEVIGTERTVLDKISETYGNAQLDQLQVLEIVGEPIQIKMKLELPVVPAV